MNLHIKVNGNNKMSMAITDMKEELESLTLVHINAHKHIQEVMPQNLLMESMKKILKMNMKSTRKKICC